MFTKAIVRTPCENMVNGITTANLGKPDYAKALLQHKQYIKALEICGLQVYVLPEDNNYPDSTFVEDVALCTPNCAIITNHGAESRKGEVKNIENILRDFYREIHKIHSPGTIEAGDIMMVGNHYYIGLSERTNENGAEQMIAILGLYGMTGSVIPLKEVLHLKTWLAYLENNNLVVAGEFVNVEEFKKFNKIEISSSESYAANCIWVNDNVIIPKGYDEAKKKISKTGYNIIELEMSEFQKLDGGLSCLSLRF